MKFRLLRHSAVCQGPMAPALQERPRIAINPVNGFISASRSFSKQKAQ